MPLVLLHGWGFNAAIWDDFIPRIQHRFRCFAVDLPGYGNSIHEPAETLQAAAVAVHDAVPSGATWLGWSLGGLVALQAALDRPLRIARLLLIATNPCFVDRDVTGNGVAATVFESFAEALSEDAALALRRFLTLQTRGIANAGALGRQLRTALAARPAPDRHALRRGLDMLRQTDLRQSLRELNLPVHAVQGNRDTLVPASVLATWAGLCPRATTTMIDGAGHAPFLSHPERVRACLEDVAVD